MSSKSRINDNSTPSPPTSTISTFSSLRSLLYKYFRSNRTEQQSSTKITSYHHTVYQKSRSVPINTVTKLNLTGQGTIHHRLSRHQRTTATFTGQKRSPNEPIDTNKLKLGDINPNQEDEQQLTRARLSTRTSSLPAARCISYYSCQPGQTLISSPTIVTKAIIEDHQGQDFLNGHSFRPSRLNSSNTPGERSRSHSHSSAACLANEGMGTTDASGHSSSFDHPVDDEHRRLNHRTQPSRLSTTFNSSRYSQRAVAQFMHERHKARLRRNQKASRMLGKKVVDVLFLSSRNQ